MANKTAKSSSTRRRQRKKYKVHYDRLFAQLLMIALVVCFIVWIVSLFRSQDGIGTESRASVTSAVEAGRRDAEKVIDATPGSMERDEALLFIRAREHELRSNGYGHAADDYINSARQLLEEYGIN